MRKRLLNNQKPARRLRHLLVLSALLLMPMGVWGQTSYGLFIGDYEESQVGQVGVRVTSDNASNITHACITSGTVSFDNDSRTLTLTNATIAGTIYSFGDLTINLVGDNYVTAVDSSAIQSDITSATQNLTFKGTGSLMATPDAYYICIEGFNTTYQDDQQLLLGDLSTPGEPIVIGTQLFSGGDGTSEHPYLIGSKADLTILSTCINNGNLVSEETFFQLSGAIDCTGLSGFEPIGTDTHPFAGTFDGNGKTISNLTMTDVNKEIVGLFGYNEGTISNLTLSGCTISGGNGSNNYIGAIVAENDGIIQGCTVKSSTVSCKANSQVPFVGGIAGLTTGSITNCVVEDTNVNAVTGDSGASGATALAGGIASKNVSGTVSGCKVKGTTTVTAEYSNQEVSVYAGAVIGDQTGTSISGNTYESTVTTKTKGLGDSGYTTLSGQDQRGIGYYYDENNYNNYDEIGKVELAGTKKVTLTTELENGEYGPKEGSYYYIDDGIIYALPGEDVIIEAHPNEGYKPVLVLSDNTIEVTSNEINEEEEEIYDHTEFTFTMPDADLTATLSFPIDLSAIDDENFTIANATYTGVAQVPTTITVAGIPGATGNTTLTSTDFTIDNYIDAATEEEVDSPIDAGTYTVTIEGKGNYTGTKDVSYTITQAANAITKTPVGATGLTYTGAAQALIATAGEASFGDVVYCLTADGTYGAAADIKGTNATPEGQPYTIYYKVVETDNYAGVGTVDAPLSFTVSIAKASITPEVNITGWSYGSYSATTNAPSVTETTNPGTGEVTYQYKVKDASDDTYAAWPAAEAALNAIAAGDYTIKATVAATDNYQTGTGTKDFTISPKSIAGATVTLSAESFVYNGANQKPTVTVKDGDTTLTLDTDYTLTNAGGTNVGEYTVTVTGKGNYDNTTTASKTFTITAKSIATATVTVTAPTTFTYTGSAQTATAYTVTMGETALTANTDYELVGYADNTNAGTATITVKGKGNYDASTTASGTFTINKANLNGVTIADIASQAYTGSAITPAVTVTFNGNAVDATEYTVGYSNNTNAGEATVTLTSANKNFTSGTTKTATFTIGAKAISDYDITLSATSVEYNGSAQTPGVTFKENGLTVTPSAEDYEVTYANNVNVGSADGEGAPTVTITGKNNLTGSVEKTFSITAKSIATATVTVTAPTTFTYTGSAQTATAYTVTMGETALTANTDYELVGYADNTNAGTATITVKGKGNYDASTTASGTFTINKANLNGVTIAAIASQAYTGSAITPAVTVTFNGVAVDATEYTVGYSNNTNAGEATVTLTSANKNFTNGTTKTATFQIVAAAGTISYATASVEKTYGDAAFTNALTNTGDGEVTYTSNKTSVATVNATTGEVTIVGAGEATITATVADGTNYTYATKTATYTLTVGNRTASTDELGFTEGQAFGTFYSTAEDLEIPEGVVAYIITGVNGNSVTTARISYIPKGVPVLVEKGTSSAEATDEADGNILYGTAADTNVSTITGGTVYVLYNDEFVKTTSGTIPAHRCYLVLSNAAGARSLSIARGDDSTGIHEIEWTLDGNEQWYSLDGKKIDKPVKKGLYIMNGNKVVVK